jgi:hypothetical protein
MNKENIKLIIVLSLLTHISVAQDQIRNDLSLYSGIINHKVVDQTISPIIYRGTTMPLFLEFNNKRKNYYHKFSANYFKLSLKSSITNTDRINIHTLENLNFLFEYSVARKILSTQNSYHSAGLKLSTFLNYRDLTMNVWASGMTTTADHASSLSLFYNFCLKDFPIVFDMLDFNISTPFISYIILEGTYNANVNESLFNIDKDKNIILQLLKNGSFVSFNKFYQINSNVILTKRINNRFSTNVSYYFNFYSFNKYEKLLQVKSLNNAILFGFCYNMSNNEN